jgi:large subunit ribosomal protein L18
MISPLDRAGERKRIHSRIRRKIRGDEQRPRLCVFRSLKHIYAQVVDDMRGTTLVAAASTEKDVLGDLKSAGNLQSAKVIGKAIAERARAKGIESVVFDRGGYLYHGRVKALAEAAREAGLKF